MRVAPHGKLGLQYWSLRSRSCRVRLQIIRRQPCRCHYDLGLSLTQPLSYAPSRYFNSCFPYWHHCPALHCYWYRFCIHRCLPYRHCQHFHGRHFLPRELLYCFNQHPNFNSFRSKTTHANCKHRIYHLHSPHNIGLHRNLLRTNSDQLPRWTRNHRYHHALHNRVPSISYINQHWKSNINNFSILKQHQH
jgi:hypothetical protein